MQSKTKRAASWPLYPKVLQLQR